jgi:hypothetical protein
MHQEAVVAERQVVALAVVDEKEMETVYCSAVPHTLESFLYPL